MPAAFQQSFSFAGIRNLFYSAKLKAFYNIWWFQETTNDRKITWNSMKKKKWDLKVHTWPKIRHVIHSPFWFPIISISTSYPPLYFINSHKAYIITHLASKTSDKFSKCSSSFKKAITIIQADIRFSAKINARKILFAVEIPPLQQRNGTE